MGWECGNVIRRLHQEVGKISVRHAKYLRRGLCWIVFDGVWAMGARDRSCAGDRYRKGREARGYHQEWWVRDRMIRRNVRTVGIVVQADRPSTPWGRC
jgi:hypothetical protein